MLLKKLSSITHNTVIQELSKDVAVVIITFLILLGLMLIDPNQLDYVYANF